MRKTTDMEAIKTIAKAYLYIEPKVDKELPFIVHHPFFSSPVTLDKKGKFVNIVEDEEALSSAISFVLEKIDKTTKYFDFYIMVQKPYRLDFYKRTKEYASEKDAGEFLISTWQGINNPNAEVNESLFQKLKMFKEINPKYLMNEEEYESFCKLPDSIVVYRGIQDNLTNVKALSWTLSLKQAKWFADRWNENRGVYKATIAKKDVIGIFDYEEEVIVDYRKLKNIERII